MSEILEMLKATYSSYNNTTEYYAMGSYIVLSIIVVIWYLCNNDKVGKDSKTLFDYSGIMLIVVFFPITAALIRDFIFDTQTYYKVFWCIPIVLIIACVGAQVCFDDRKQKIDKVVLLVMVMILTMAGVNPFLETNYYKTNKYLEAENLLKINNDVVHIGEYLNGQGEQVKIISPPEITINIRKYSSNITTFYGMDILDDDIKEIKYSNILYLYDTMNSNYPDIPFLISLAEQERCNYIILRNINYDETIAGYWEDIKNVLITSGFSEVQVIGKYSVFYKNNSLE